MMYITIFSGLDVIVVNLIRAAVITLMKMDLLTFSCGQKERSGATLPVPKGILGQKKMVIKHSFTVTLLLMYAYIMGTISTRIAAATTTAIAATTTTTTTSNATKNSSLGMTTTTTTTTTTSNATRNSSPGMLSSSPTSPQDIPSPMSTAQLRSSLNPGTKPSELISKSTWQGNMTSSPCINTTAETVAGSSTPLRPVFNTHSLFLCSIFTLLYILRQK